MRLLIGNSNEPVFATNAHAIKKGRASSFRRWTNATTIGVRIIAVVSSDKTAVVIAPRIKTFL